MNYLKTVLVMMLAVSIFSVQAKSARELLGQPTVQMDNKPSRDIDPNSKTYGVYVLQSTLIALPQSIASRPDSSKELGNFTLVATEKNSKTIDEFRRNAVVKNSVTGELGVITGNLTILLKDNVNIQQLEQQFSFTIMESAEETGIYIVQPSTEQNLIPIQDQLKRSGLVKAVRLDILENKYKNQ